MSTVPSQSYVPARTVSSNAPVPVHGMVITLTIEAIGVGLMAALAESSPGIGKIMVTIMVGFFLIFILANVSYFQSLVGKMGKYA